uniref:hypothetical protein n=1 Tax=Halobacteriovorax sp. TaxID=2020862 RepID=UPI003566F33D
MKLKSKTFIFITLLLLSSCARIENRRDVASTAEVQSSCSEITKQFLKRSNHKSNLQNLKSSLLQINVDDYKTKDLFEEVEDRFKRTIAKIKNVDELFDIFDFLKVISSVKRVDQGKVHLFASKIQYLISQGNL